MSNWVLLRGLMREARHWGRFPAALRAEIPDAIVTTLDLPGNGRLHLMPSPQRVEETAEFCRLELRAQGIRPPYRLIALSLGAMVAVSWAERHPEDLDGCVLINTSLRPFSPFHQRLKPRNYPSLLAALLSGDTLKQERLILRLTSCHGDAQADVLGAWNAYRRECPVSRRNALHQLMAAIRYRAPACRPAVPMLVLASERDRLVDMRCSKSLASQWQADLAIHPEAGHDLPLDDAPWVARQTSDWLQNP